MNILVILGHPKKGQLLPRDRRQRSPALKETGHEVLFHDLYEERSIRSCRSTKYQRKGRLLRT